MNPNSRLISSQHVVSKLIESKGTTPSSAAATDKLLLVDGTSYLLLVDGTSKLLLAS